MNNDSLRGMIKIPDFFTLANLCFGTIALFFAFADKINLAMLFLLFSACFDFLDGKVARYLNRQGDFGKELDSLADIVSFGVVPVVIGIKIVGLGFLNCVIFLIFICCGALRLARHNTINGDGYYRGLPIPFSVVVVALYYFLAAPKEYLVFVYLLLAVLFISSFRIFKKI